jgi:IclR family transcriptional regulator, KDG regulon repressor
MLDKMGSSSVIDRVIDILLLFNGGKEYWSIEDIAQELDLPKSTSYRLVRALQERGLLEKVEASHYQLGAAFLQLSRVALNSNRDIRLKALPSMKRIAEAIRESVSLMRLMNRQAVCIESIEGQYALRVSIEQGRIQPLHAGASSRVLLAHLPEKDWISYLQFPLQRFTDTTLTDFDALRENLRMVRNNGYAISNGEIDLGAKAVAIPLIDNREQVVAALSIEAPATRMTDETVANCLQTLIQEAALIRKQQP